MTRDQQIGLALGILLVGAVSAFFFRHENPPARKLPALKTAAELDREIAERQHVPYLPESDDDADDASAATTDPFLMSDSTDAGLVPEPIALDGEADSVLVSNTSTALAPVREQYHIVRNGDTLSSIAQQYLGSTAKYQDVYEANRDRLRTPNDLRIGQELRIPLPAALATTPPVTRMTQNDKPSATLPSETPPAAEGDSERRFVPFRGSPLTPGTKEPSSATPSNTSGRRLSQLPPKRDTVIR